MSNIVGAIKDGVIGTFAVVPVVAGVVITRVVDPVVSLAALPIFAAQSFSNGSEYKNLHNRNLTNNTRAKFGRIEGQD